MLKIGKSAPFEEDIEKATSENNLTEDWAAIMQICDNVINYQDGAKFCLKAILKRLHHSVPRVVLQTLTLLDSCVKNCDRRFLLQVASSEFTNEVRKLLGKMHPSAADKFKELIKKWSLEEFKDDPELGIIPSLYYKLKSEGVDFPSMEKEKKTVTICTDPNAVTSQEEENDIIKAIEISLKDTGKFHSSSEYGASEFRSDAPAPVKTFKVRAMYDFEAAEDNELTIKAGEVVLVLDNSNNNWWKGSNHRGEGLFPANFVTDDLEYKAEEPFVETKSEEDAVPNTSFTGEVKIDEEKIEVVINWLNETDPAGEIPDSQDMLRLEDEVYKMGPLIEDKLESVDKRIAMLNQVNEKIVSAFITFHSLDDNLASMQNTMKFPVKNFPPVSQQQVAAGPPAMNPPMHGFPPQHMMFYPVPPPQPIPANDAGSNGPMVQPEALPQMNNPQGMSSDSLASNSVTTVTSSSQVGPAPALMNPYNQNMGGYYIPPGMQYPMQYQANPAVPQQQGFVQTSGSTPNFMSIPHYSMPTMGPYVPLPYYYMNSASPAPMNTSVASANPIQDNSKVAATTTAVTPSVSTYPAYSSDLNSMALGNSDVSYLEEKNEQSAESSSQSSSNIQSESSVPTNSA